jgi:23S rRNA pseudouridine2605 synthase
MSNTRGGRKKALPQEPPRDVHVPDGVRLQKVLATAGLGSRRACENLITNGRVEVDGVRVTELGVRIDPVKNAVHVDGMRIQLDTSLVTIALNKPLGVVSTMHDPEGRPTLAQFVADRPERLFHVGRLDAESEGLLLLTNDGDLAARLTHPSHGVARVYEARVLGVPDEHDLDRLARGIVIDGRRTGPADVKLQPLRRDGNEATLIITLREGRNRQVRNMCDAIGHPVNHLKRVAIGPLRDPKLKLGYWRELTPAEVERLQKAASRDTASQAQHRGHKGDKGHRGKTTQRT